MKSIKSSQFGRRIFSCQSAAAFMALSALSAAHGQTNTITGVNAGARITKGTNNTANGYKALSTNKTGSFNTAVGSTALLNASGSNNVAVGFEALWKNSTGGFNVAIGDGALRSNTTGSRNVAIGEDAGIKVTTGSDNIYIDNQGVSGESRKIRIGTPGIHTDIFLSGVIHGNGSGLTGVAGPAGPKGSVGPAGPTGATGAQGASGSPGAAGIQGIPGIQGIQGIQGPIGPQGISAASTAASVFPEGMQEFATPGGPYTFIIPEGVSRIMVEVWGGGGGGGGSGVRSVLGGGGGAGAYSRKLINVVRNLGGVATATISVGRGGAEGMNKFGTTSPTAGSAGTGSGFSLSITEPQSVTTVNSGGGGGGGFSREGNDDNSPLYYGLGGTGGVPDSSATLRRTQDGENGFALEWFDGNWRFSESAGGLAFTQVPVGPPVGTGNGGGGALFLGGESYAGKGGDGYVLITW